MKQMLCVAHVTVYFVDGFAATPVSDFHNGHILIYYQICQPLLQYFELKENADEMSAYISLQFCIRMPSFSLFTLHISSRDVSL